MRRIVLTGGPAAPTTVSISIVVGFNELSVQPPLAGGADWGGIDASGVPAARLYGRINGSLKNSIRVGQLYWFSAGGSIEAQIWADDAGNFGQCVVEAGSIAAGGSVRVDKGNILRIKAFGAMAGNITAGGAIVEPDPNTSPDGIIERIEVGTNLTGNVYALGSNASIKILQVGGNVTGKVYAEYGSFGDVTITGALESQDTGVIWPIRSKNGINRLIAGSISANITAATNGGLGKVGLIKTTNGPMTKGLALKELINPEGGGDAGIIINGDLSGDIKFIASGARANGILIKGSLVGRIHFDDPQQLGNNPLNNQIIINAANASGVWANGGKVQFGDLDTPYIVMSPSAPLPTDPPLYLAPYYDATPAQLGGGSIGVVPFALHDYACVPTNPPLNGAPGEVTMTVDQQVVLEFYGPVRAENNSNRPFHVWFLIPGTEDDWYEATDWFTGITSGRKLILTRYACIPKGLYLVEQALPGMNRLMCDVPGFPGTSAPVADFGYLFKVIGSGADCPCYYVPWECSQCAADFDGNGGVDGGDISAFLLNFEAGCACADVDHNGGVEGGDLAVFFDLFEAGGC